MRDDKKITIPILRKSNPGEKIIISKLHFKVTGLYTTPLTVEGPIFDDG